MLKKFRKKFLWRKKIDANNSFFINFIKYIAVKKRKAKFKIFRNFVQKTFSKKTLRLLKYSGLRYKLKLSNFFFFEHDFLTNNTFFFLK